METINPGVALTLLGLLAALAILVGLFNDGPLETGFVRVVYVALPLVLLLAGYYLGRCQMRRNEHSTPGSQ